MNEGGVSLTNYQEQVVSLFEKYFSSTVSTDVSDSISAGIENLNTFFKERNINVFSPCTADSSAASSCWILSNLTPWNEILDEICWELIEDRTGHLTLRSLRQYEYFTCLGYNIHHDVHMIVEAYILCHFLLKQHHCIGTVDVLHSEMAMELMFLYCDALMGHSGIDYLVVYPLFPHATYGRQLLSTYATMRHLQKLELRDRARNCDPIAVISRHRTESRSSFWAECLEKLQSCRYLKHLTLDIAIICSQGLTHLTALLRNNRNLEQVSIGRFQLWPTELQRLAESLAASPLQNLKKLELMCQFEEYELPSLIDALKKLKSLTSLTFSETDVDVQSLVGCAQEGVLNLQKLKLYYVATDDDGILSVADLVRTDAIRVVNLMCHRPSKHQMETLFAAVAASPEVLLRLGHIDIDDTETWDLPSAQLAHSVGNRVQMYYNGPVSPKLTAALKTNSHFFRELTIEWALTTKPEELENLLIALQSNKTVVKLSVEATPITNAFMHALAKLLHVNQTLRCLDLVMTLVACHLNVLFNALKEGTVLSQLVTGSCRFSRTSFAAFCNMLRMNTALTLLAYYSQGTYNAKEVRAALAENHTLRVFQREPQSESRFFYNEIQRRNQATLNKALTYALKNSLSADQAVAFDRVCRSGDFVFHLAKLAGISEDEARDRVKSTRRYISLHYFLLTGVVNSRLECTGKERVELDVLNTDCLQEIFSCLKLTDVRM